MGNKWKDYEAKKVEFRRSIALEREENLRAVREEYTKLEQERARLEDNKRGWNEEKMRIEREKTGLIDDFRKISSDKEWVAEELRKQQDQQNVMKQSFENQIMSLRSQVIYLVCKLNGWCRLRA